MSPSPSAPQATSLYVSVDTAVKLVEELGRGTLLSKVDIRSAYGMLPIHPDDCWLLGMRWEGSVFVDTALPFGLGSAPKIFTAVADTLEWIVKHEGVSSVIHYLDDFLLAGSVLCARDLNNSLVFQYRYHGTTTSPPTGQARGDLSLYTWCGRATGIAGGNA